MNQKFLQLALVFIATVATSSLEAADKIKVLLLDGPQKAHKYLDTTPVLKQVLENSPLFVVEHSRSSKETCKDGSYQPEFSNYDVVVMNEGFGAADWPEPTQRDFEKLMADGGGMVSVHAANNCWPKWEEYNKMTALGGWGGRNEKSGPYLYLNDEGEVVRDESKGRGGDHGPQHEFEIVVREREHPIMKGLPATFMHGPEELYDRLRGPAENMTILASAFSAKNKKGTERHEPALMTISYGEGRIFHTILGHHVKQIQEGSFVTTFVRGTEWAATGEVTIPVPEDFPNQKFGS